MLPGRTCSHHMVWKCKIFVVQGGKYFKIFKLSFTAPKQHFKLGHWLRIALNPNPSLPHTYTKLHCLYLCKCMSLLLNGVLQYKLLQFCVLAYELGHAIQQHLHSLRYIITYLEIRRRFEKHIKIPRLVIRMYLPSFGGFCCLHFQDSSRNHSIESP